MTNEEIKEHRRMEWALQEAWANDPRCPSEERIMILEEIANAKAIHGS